MLEVYLRPIYQFCIVNPIAKFTKYEPTKITIVACLTGILAAASLTFNVLVLATILLLISGFLDSLDGAVARLTNKTSDIGTVFDILSDRIVEFAIILGLFLQDPAHRSLEIILMLGSCYLCITSFLVVGMFIPNQSKKGFYYNPGLIERLEVFIFFLLMIWFPEHFTMLAILFSSLILLTSYLHIKQFLRLKVNVV